MRVVRITLKKPKNKNQKRDGSRDTDDRLRDLPEWLENFKDNLEDAELHAPAHNSQNSDSERPTKVVSRSRKHSIYTHFPQDRNCEVCFRTKMTRAPCRRRTGEALRRAENFVDLITADHMRDVNPETIIGTLSWYKILPLNGFKQNPHMRRKKFVKILGAVAQTESCVYRQLDGIWEIM